jgi:hypothetical protein
MNQVTPEEQNKYYFALVGLIVAIAPAIAYLATYSFKVGYAVYFGIDLDLTSLSWGALFSQSHGLLIIGFYAVCAASIGFIALYFGRGIEKHFYNFFIVSVFPLFVIVMYKTSYNKIPIGSFGYELYIAIALWLIGALFLIIAPKVRYFQKLEKTWANDVITLRYAGKFLLILSYILFIFVLFYMIGYDFAKDRRSFMILSNKPELAVLAVNGNMLVTAPFDRKTKKLRPDFMLVTISSQIIKFHWENIGPLKPSIRVKI